MGRRSPYSEESGKDAVALFRAAAGKRTYAAVAADLGVTAESLRTWVRKDEAPAMPDGRDAGVSVAEELARLRAENTRLAAQGLVLGLKLFGRRRGIHRVLLRARRAVPAVAGPFGPHPVAQRL
ncbi:transposase, partial [Streptomyces sp. NPDC056632]|uniref:transposase n=1 Tax=Streptomyces sp. NPDC056632 TaxID=3345884 RepID=UPI0036777AD2